MSPLLLLPGLLCTDAVFAPQIAALAGVADCRVADLTRDDTIPGMARRALAAMPSGRFALAGFSMGGYVALEMMRQAPARISRLALMATSPRVDTPERARERERFIALARGDGFRPITAAMIPFLVHPDRVGDAALVAVVREMGERVGAAAYVRQQTAMLARADSEPHLGAIRCPTLVLCGAQDRRATPEVHEAMARAIPGARLVIVPDCGHMATLERPDAVNAALRDWLGDGEDGAGARD